VDIAFSQNSKETSGIIKGNISEFGFIIPLKEDNC
jgi:hypothetical protein